MTRVELAILAMLLLFAGSFSPLGSANLQIDITGPYTQNVTDDSITVVWETSSPTANNSVEYGENESYGHVKYATGGSHHEVTINPASSSGHYRVISDDRKSGDFEFELASHCHETGHFKAVIFGDSRGEWDNWVHAREVSDAVNAGHPDFAIHGGDMVSDGASRKQWDEWLGFSIPLMQNSTLFGVLGNHDRNNSRYYEIFSLPNNEMWYSFDYGPCHFVILDDYAPWGMGSNQYRWLENDLSSTSKPFRIVCFHEPIYCSGGHSPRVDIRLAWEPLFKKYDVNLVFQSHNHYYQRTEQIGGITYIVTGGAGAPLYEPEDASFVNNSRKAYHYCVLDVSIPDMEIRCSARYVNGTPFDEFIIKSPSELKVNIAKPDNALYFFDKKIMPLPFPVIIGGVGMGASVSSTSGVESVGFYIDGNLKYNDTEAPYEWLWDEHAIGGHEITVRATDANDNTAADSRDVWIFNL